MLWESDSTAKRPYLFPRQTRKFVLRFFPHTHEITVLFHVKLEQENKEVSDECAKTKYK